MNKNKKKKKIVFHPRSIASDEFFIIIFSSKTCEIINVTLHMRGGVVGAVRVRECRHAVNQAGK